VVSAPVQVKPGAGTRKLNASYTLKVMN